MTERTRRPGLSRNQRLGLRLAGAGLLAATGAIHLDLYLTGYRSIPVIGWLFLLQVIAAFVLAVAVLVSGNRLAAAAGAGFALSTLGGYLLSVWIGLFGFTEVRTTAGIVAGVIEVAAFAALAALAAVPAARGQPTGQAAFRGPLLARLQAGIPGAGRAIAGVSVLALVLLGIGVAGAGGPPTAGGRWRADDREDCRRDRAHQCQGVHAVLVRPGHPGQVKLQRDLRRLLAAGDRHPAAEPSHHRQAWHDQAVRRHDPGDL